MPVPISNLSATFANSQQTFVGLGLNVSYTAAATGSRLFELKVNNEPKFWIGLNGVPSTNLSSNDSVARTLAQDAYDLASSLIGVNQSNVYLTISGANTIVGVGANAFAAATIAGANVAVGTGANNYSNDTFVKLSAIAQTISGNVNFDASTLFVDSVGNKVSIGRTDGTYALDVVGSINASAVLVNGVAPGGLGDVTSATLSGANTAVGAGANAFAAATIAGANTISIAAFNRANTPNVYVANTNGVMTVVYSSERKIINFIDTPANTGVGVRITDNVAIGASDIQIFSYDMLANNVSLNGLSGVSINNTILPRRYKMITFHFDEVSFSTTATLRVAASIDNGSNFTFYNISNSQLAANTVSGVTTIHAPYGSGSTTRKVVNTFTAGFDGTNLNFTNSMYSSSALLYGAPINWINFYPSTGTFDGGVLTILGYY